MKNLIISLTLMASLNSFANKMECSFPPLIAGEDSSIFWAQEYVGADLLRKELGLPQKVGHGIKCIT